MIRDRAGLRVLEPEECLQLLDDHLPRIGRVAFADGDRVVVLPVNYRVDGEAIVFRTGEDTSLGALADGTSVSFQADEVDAAWAEGWSVLAEGPLEAVADVDQLERLRRLPLHPWAPGDKSKYMRVRPERLSGRRIE